MKIKLCTLLFILATSNAFADLHANLLAVHNNRTQNESLGQLTFTEDTHGILITPKLHGLNPGLHALRYTVGKNCNAVLMKSSLNLPTTKPDPTFFPPFIANQEGNVDSKILANNLSFSALNQKMIILYDIPTQYPDQQFPYFAGNIVACGVVSN